MRKGWRSRDTAKERHFLPGTPRIATKSQGRNYSGLRFPPMLPHATMYYAAISNRACWPRSFFGGYSVSRTSVRAARGLEKKRKNFRWKSRTPQNKLFHVSSSASQPRDKNRNRGCLRNLSVSLSVLFFSPSPSSWHPLFKALLRTMLVQADKKGTKRRLVMRCRACIDVTHHIRYLTLYCRVVRPPLLCFLLLLSARAIRTE